MEHESNNIKHIGIIGAGLVGALNACYFGQKGFKVTLFEKRKDIRQIEFVKGRSINLAMSCRGRAALKGVGLEDTIVETGIPMYARMIHNTDGSLKRIPYGKENEAILSTDRRLLNEVLLNEAEKYPRVEFKFEHAAKNIDLFNGNCKFENKDGLVDYTFDLIVGCDGNSSVVRQTMAKVPVVRFDYSQEYIPHGYMELSMPCKANGEYAMSLNYLHIWPRNKFMMIGLPNKEDMSFVLTLFMPWDVFQEIKTEDDVVTFFEKYYPDSIDLIGKEDLIKTFMNSKPLPLLTIKCNTYHVANKTVIMGDSAHAMVPFYGQGMNCGFEDVLLFHQILDEFKNDFNQALPEFTARRNEDAKAMCDLALFNYIEMRESVNSKLFLLRKKFDNFLYDLMPKIWVPLYTSVSFTRIRYSQCIRNRKWQDKIINRILLTSGFIVSATAAILLKQYGPTHLIHMDEIQNLLSVALSPLRRLKFKF